MVKEENKETKTKSATKAEAKKTTKKPAAKKSTAKKTTAKKTTVKKTTVKKTSTKKGTTGKAKKDTDKKTVNKTAAKKSKTTKITSKKKPSPKKASKDTKNTSQVEYKPSFKTHYRDKIIPTMMMELGYKNALEVPRLRKISLNVGIGDTRNESGVLQKASDDLAIITGQKAVITKARKAISNFKLRIGEPVGCRVTLRGWKMYEFLERLISIALPRVRDFRGLSAKSFDGRGNYSLGIQEHVVFPEIDYDTIDKIRGMDISIVTSAETDREGYELLKLLGFPFRLDNRFEREKNENGNEEENSDAQSEKLTEEAEVA